MNKIQSLLCVSFLVLFLASVSFAIADNTTCEDDSDCGVGEICSGGVCIEEPECGDEDDCMGDDICVDGVCIEPECKHNSDCEDNEVCVKNECEAVEEELEEAINKNVKIPFVNVVSIWNGFIINEEDEAEQVRVFITKKRYNNILSIMNQETLDEIQEIRDDEEETPEGIRERIKQLLKEKVQDASEETSVGGLLTIGKGNYHETYRIVSTEIDEETANFDVYTMGAIKVKTKYKPGFFIGLRRAFGLADEEETTEVEEEVEVEEIEPIGTLTIERNLYEHLEIGYGTLELELDETEYEGTWDITVYSPYKVSVYKGNMGQGNGNGNGNGNQD